MTKTTCEIVQPELKAYLDRMLSPLAAFRVTRHLRNCEQCRQELGEIMRVGKELHSIASEMTAGSDTLEPALRARILAAITTEPIATPQDSRRPFRWKPVMAIGTLAAAVFSILVLLPHGLRNSLVLHRMAESKANRQSLEFAENGASSVSAKSEQDVAGGAVPATAAPMLPASKQSDSLMMDGHSKGGFGSGSLAASGSRAATAPMTQSGNIGAQMQASVTDGLSSTVNHVLAKTPASAAGDRPKSEVNLSRPAGRNVHTFLVSNLSEGEQSVRQAASSFNGSVVGRTGVMGSNTVELTVTLSAAQSGAFADALSRISGVAMQPQLSGNTGSSSRKTTGFSDGHPSGPSGAMADLKLNGYLVDNANPQTPSSGVEGRSQTRATASRGSLIGGALKADNKSGKAFSSGFGRGSGKALATITIVLAKRH